MLDSVCVTCASALQDAEAEGALVLELAEANARISMLQEQLQDADKSTTALQEKYESLQADKDKIADSLVSPPSPLPSCLLTSHFCAGDCAVQTRGRGRVSGQRVLFFGCRTGQSSVRK